MKASSRLAQPRAFTSSAGVAHRENPSGVHESDAVAAGGLVHEMGRDENGHALVARQIAEKLPELVARQRIDAGCRLVEDKNVRPVHDRDGERQALANAEREIGGALVEIIGEPKTRDELVDTGSGAAGDERAAHAGQDSGGTLSSVYREKDCDI